MNPQSGNCWPSVKLDYILLSQYLHACVGVDVGVADIKAHVTTAVIKMKYSAPNASLR